MRTPRAVALVDGNNFYVSCELVFRPDLEHRPVVVMSSNDGCVIARSEEAKLLGIGMGQPVFEVRDIVRRHGVALCSANFALYGDMSGRINEILRSFSPDVEMYSIDESFVDLSGHLPQDPVALGRRMRDRIRNWTGIPACVGIGPTKVLAKLANAVAKRDPIFRGVCNLGDERLRRRVLDLTAVEDVWGVGRAIGRKLTAQGIRTASRLAEMPPARARSLGTVTLERLILELRGIPCLELETMPPPRKSVGVTRSFGQPVGDFEEVMESVTQHVARAGEKLRKEDLVAGEITVFMHTSSRRGGTSHCGSVAGPLSPMTSDTRRLLEVAHRCARSAWREGCLYVKSGVFLEDLRPRCEGDAVLFESEDLRSRSLMDAVDRINRRYGSGALFPASRGVKRRWRSRQFRLSPRYTTRIGEVPVVRA